MICTSNTDMQQLPDINTKAYQLINVKLNNDNHNKAIKL